ncbi:C-Jun-amino-terminal kinase-interacting protein 1 [Larimichthys crocea]|uniref:Uncharacterized protein n=1 Tax=Larimichthys crocea TaxID=215358 RepID=A0ACD3R2C5_LARCR|nr:C-Jun-amino-terminal kinase-interacting protein 1 [Larimichthys crocea]
MRSTSPHLHMLPAVESLITPPSMALSARSSLALDLSLKGAGTGAGVMLRGGIIGGSAIGEEYEEEDEEDGDGTRTGGVRREATACLSEDSTPEVDMHFSKKFLNVFMNGRSSSSSAESFGLYSCIINGEEKDQSHRAVYRFVPRHDDELELEVDDPLLVEVQSEDYWYEGYNMRTGARGIFPAYYAIEVTKDPESFKVKSSEWMDRYRLKFLGSVQVPFHKGNDVLCAAMQKIATNRRMTVKYNPPSSCILEISVKGIKLAVQEDYYACDRSNECNHFFQLKNVSFCGYHPKNSKYFGFITKHPADQRFACHVFVSENSTKPLAESVGTDRYNREVIVSGSLYMLWVFDGFLPGRVKDRLVAIRYHQSFQSNKSSFRGKIKGLVTAMRSTAVTAGISCCFVLLLFSLNFLYSEEQWRTVVRPKIQITDSLNFGARENVETRTTWNAPIMWEGMFDPNLYDQKHIEGKSAVALTVFAVGRYLDAYLKTFLVSAEQHFMLGLPVTYYVFTDLPEKVPNVMLNAKRHLKIIQVQKYSRWQDISMMRMKMISEIIETDIRYHFSYVFCFDVDQEFKGRFGSEALGDSVALLHAHYYKLPKERFTYDRNPKSKAFMETGDFYYHAAIFGGLWENVKNLTDTCYVNIMEDKLYDCGGSVAR